LLFHPKEITALLLAVGGLGTAKRTRGAAVDANAASDAEIWRHDFGDSSGEPRRDLLD
jgi:hypothetical protein